MNTRKSRINDPHVNIPVSYARYIIIFLWLNKFVCTYFHLHTDVFIIRSLPMRHNVSLRIEKSFPHLAVTFRCKIALLLKLPRRCRINPLLICQLGRRRMVSHQFSCTFPLCLLLICPSAFQTRSPKDKPDVKSPMELATILSTIFFDNNHHRSLNVHLSKLSGV